MRYTNTMKLFSTAVKLGGIKKAEQTVGFSFAVQIETVTNEKTLKPKPIFASFRLLGDYAEPDDARGTMDILVGLGETKEELIAWKMPKKSITFSVKNADGEFEDREIVIKGMNTPMLGLRAAILIAYFTDDLAYLEEKEIDVAYHLKEMGILQVETDITDNEAERVERERMEAEKTNIVPTPKKKNSKTQSPELPASRANVGNVQEPVS